MLSCKQVTELASQRQETPLPLRTRIAMRLHLLICAMCARYVKQLDFIRRAMLLYRERPEQAGQPQLSGEGRAKILEAIRRETGDQD